MSKRKSKRLFEIKSFDEIMKMENPGPRDLGRALVMSFCYTEHERLMGRPGQTLIPLEKHALLQSQMTEEDWPTYVLYNRLIEWITRFGFEAKYHAERGLCYSSDILHSVEQEYLIAPARHAIETMRGLLTEEQKAEARRLGYDPDKPIYFGRLGLDPYTPNANKVEAGSYTKKALSIMCGSGMTVDNSILNKGNLMLDSVEMMKEALTFSYRLLLTYNTIISITSEYLGIPEMGVFVLKAWPLDGVLELHDHLMTPTQKRITQYSADKKEAEARLKALDHMKTLSAGELGKIPQATLDYMHSIIEDDLRAFNPVSREHANLTMLLGNWDVPK